MTADQMRACAILGIRMNATVEEIVAAWKQMMRLVHPDKGGSEFLAQQVNWARDTLLGKRAGSRPDAAFRNPKANGSYRRPPHQQQDRAISVGKGPVAVLVGIFILFSVILATLTPTPKHPTPKITDAHKAEIDKLRMELVEWQSKAEGLRREVAQSQTAVDEANNKLAVLSTTLDGSAAATDQIKFADTAARVAWDQELQRRVDSACDYIPRRQRIDLALTKCVDLHRSIFAIEGPDWRAKWILHYFQTKTIRAGAN